MFCKIVLILILVVVSNSVYSQHSDGRYTYRNEKGMVCDLVFSEDGWKVSVNLNMGSVSNSKQLKGVGQWLNQGGGEWYQVNTENCSFDFDQPNNQLKISIYDCEKSGLKAKEYVLKKTNK